MDDKGVEVEVIELGEIDGRVPAVLEIVEDRMMQDDKDQQGDLQFPFLVGDEDSAGDESNKMHFEEPMHLIDVLRHEQSDHDAENVLIKVGTGQGELDGIIGDEGQAADPESDHIGPEIVGEIDADEKEADQKVVHEPVGPTPDVGMEKGGLFFQVI